jgi:hypothetical protein
MRRRLLLVLASWPFLSAVAILLINDWWLKAASPGWVSGKLSDFAGIAVVALIALAVRPERPLLIYAGCTAVFAWWKSPLSAPLIEFVNAHAMARIGRTVDYTDLIALLVLPACSRIGAHAERFTLPWPRLRRAILIPVVAATAFGTAATSMAPMRDDYSDGAPATPESTYELIADEASRHGMACDACPLSDGTMVYKGNGLTMSYTVRSSGVVAFSIEPLQADASSCEKSRTLRAALTTLLEKQHRLVQYVDRSPPEVCR